MIQDANFPSMRAKWRCRQGALLSCRAWFSRLALVVAALAGAALVVPDARAQLGASPEQMAKAYGPVFRHNARIWHRQLYESSLVDGDIYQHGTVYIRAVFRQGKAVLLEYIKADAMFTDKEIDALLMENADGSHWETGKDSTAAAKNFRRLDNQAIAQWETGVDGSLLVSVEASSRIGEKLLQ